MTKPEPGPNYEDVRLQLSRLKAAAGEVERRLAWVIRDHLGLARDQAGRVEIFVVGPELHIADPVVRHHTRHDSWNRSGGDPLLATRLALPGEEHFDAVAAFICAHLLETGIGTDPQVAMSRTEPVIALAFEQSRARREAVLGLCGELLVLRALLREVPARAAEIIDGWHGHVRSSRDLQLGTLGVEVKTTERATSQHPVSGTYQVEVGHGVGGVEETALLLASIGAENVPGIDVPNSWTLPSLVTSLIALLGEQPDGARLSERLLVHVRDYGGGGQRYDHHAMRDDPQFAVRWRTTFVRFYDMTDPLVDVLRSSLMQSITMIDPDSVSFDIRMPMQVDGDVNPVVGMAEGARALRRLAWPSSG